MGTNHITSIASESRAPEAIYAEVPGGRVTRWLRQLLCGLHGHDAMLQFERDRLFLQCVTCGHATPGWSLNEAPPTVTARGEAHPSRLRPHLISARRIA